MGTQLQIASPTSGGPLQDAWRQKGFRRSVLLFSVAALIAFIANLSFAVWATTSHEISEGIGVIAERSCSETRKLNAGIHVLINTISTTLLAGSNYCMQCLSAPTRSQVDEAHKLRRWMDVGIHSVRNVLSPTGNHRVSRRRVVLWLLLGLSSLPLHLFYNSAVFESLSVNGYNVWVMTEDWVDTGKTTSMDNFTRFGIPNTQLAPLRTAISEGRLQRLDPVACVDAYLVAFQSDRSDVVLIADAQNNSAVNFGAKITDSNARFDLDRQDRCGQRHSYQWVCRQYDPTAGSTFECHPPCDQFRERLRSDARAGVWAPYDNRTVQHCYSLPSGEHCKLQFSTKLIYTIVVLNLVKAVLMFLCAFGWKSEPPLLTVGDAICSFLQRPDLQTEDMCLYTKDAMQSVSRGYYEPLLQVFDGTRRSKARSASGSKWTAVVLLLSLAIAVCLFLFLFGVAKMKGEKDFGTLISMGFGILDSRTFMTTRLTGVGPGNLLQNVVVANLPQLIFSFIYFAYNGIFTTMSLATEWSGYGVTRKGLRRSGGGGGALAGAQRSAYFLQLPYRVALPLLVVSGTMHWLISQSIFLVYLEVYGPSLPAYTGTEHLSGAGKGAQDLITCAWSPAAVLCTVVVVALMLVALLSMAQRRLPTAMPIVGSCSAAIAAGCHPPAAEQEGKMWEKELQWGVTQEPEGEGRAGHCSFSSAPVSSPVQGLRYQ